LHFYPESVRINISKREAKQMSEIMTQEQLSVPYNPNLLVTYKVVEDKWNPDSTTTFKTDKVTQIEWELHGARATANELSKKRSEITWLEDQVAEWYDPNYTKEEILAAIIQYFEFNPTKEIEIQGTVSFSGTINVPLSEIEDFNLSNVTIDVDLSSYEYDADLTVDDIIVEDHY
jgi:hypothetical protein